MKPLLSQEALDAIAALGHKIRLEEDVKPALAAVGLPFKEAHSIPEPEWARTLTPTTTDHIATTLRDLDLSNSDVVSRILQFTARISEVYAAAPDADQSCLVRLRTTLVS